MGAACGVASDGCGGIQTCPPCAGDEFCNTSNVCVGLTCTPKTCAELGVECGPTADGCGGLTPDCGTCAGSLSCKNGACVNACTPQTCGDVGANCGFIADGCGGSVSCGVCQPGFECGYGGKPNVCGQYQPR
jgi:hypothetical protein